MLRRLLCARWLARMRGFAQPLVALLKCEVKFDGQVNELFNICFFGCFGCDFLARSRHTLVSLLLNVRLAGAGCVLNQNVKPESLDVKRNSKSCVLHRTMAGHPASIVREPTAKLA